MIDPKNMSDSDLEELAKLINHSVVAMEMDLRATIRLERGEFGGSHDAAWYDSRPNNEDDSGWEDAYDTWHHDNVSGWEEHARCVGYNLKQDKPLDYMAQYEAKFDEQYKATLLPNPDALAEDHLMNAHDTKADFDCPICFRTFMNQDGPFEHTATHDISCDCQEISF